MTLGPILSLLRNGLPPLPNLPGGPPQPGGPHSHGSNNGPPGPVGNPNGPPASTGGSGYSNGPDLLPPGLARQLGNPLGNPPPLPGGPGNAGNGNGVSAPAPGMGGPATAEAPALGPMTYQLPGVPALPGLRLPAGVLPQVPAGPGGPTAQPGGPLAGQGAPGPGGPLASAATPATAAAPGTTAAAATAPTTAVPMASTAPVLAARPGEAALPVQVPRQEPGLLDRLAAFLRAPGPLAAGSTAVATLPSAINAAAAGAAGSTTTTAPLALAAQGVVVDARGIPLAVNDRGMPVRNDLQTIPMYTADGPLRRRRVRGSGAGVEAWLQRLSQRRDAIAGDVADELADDRWFALRWLYWMLAIIAYGCLALALIAFAGFDATWTPPPSTGRSALGLGLLASVAAFLLARRLSKAASVARDDASATH